MNELDRNDPTDPSTQGAFIGALIAALLTLLVAFGVPLSPEQTEAILGFAAVAAPITTALWIRRTAWKPSSVARRVDAVERAVHDGPPEDLSTYEPDIVDRP